MSLFRLIYSQRTWSFGHLSTRLLKPLLKPPSVNLGIAESYKVKRVLQLRCRYCYFIRVRGRLHVECTKHGRHKQMEPFNVKLLW
ncbi:Ribosomal L36 domain containing protein [Trichuris trichiura]|uniref:Large ribosomal subunit protein bL36m n=1 Tax=Trichuris trichiura TaxID=36087 RepID=A0A077Z6F2_TRITR|nr:Ribosomal L36 domain containing protein [Trichuris trichiura]